MDTIGDEARTTKRVKKWDVANVNRGKRKRVNDDRSLGGSVVDVIDGDMRTTKKRKIKGDEVMLGRIQNFYKVKHRAKQKEFID